MAGGDVPAVSQAADVNADGIIGLPEVLFSLRATAGL
jgi:hypothetical protein